MEFDRTRIFGINALIKSVSYTKQSKFFLHFFKHLALKRFSRSWGIVPCMFL